MTITIINKKNYTKIPNKQHLTFWINKIIKKQLNININITNKLHIKILNKKYRNINKPTDILTFKNEYIIKNTIGDIIICKQLIKSNKQKTLENWHIIITHGVLHLLNYDHKKNYDNYIMCSLQKKIGMSGIEPPTTTTSK